MQEEQPQIIIHIPITRVFVCSRKDLYFLYGHDYAGRGFAGQAWQLHNEPNTWPIYTMLKYCSAKNFFSDDINEHWGMVLESLKRVPLDRPIIPCPKIGCGCSRMFELAPKLYAAMVNYIDKLKYPNIKYVYGNH